MVRVPITPAVNVLALVEYTEDKHLGFADTIEESEGVHDKLADFRVAIFRDHGAAFTEGPEGVGCIENALEQTSGIADGILDHE
jgi:hypothetical protein